MPNKELIKEAIELFGMQTVHEVISLEELSDADGIYCMFEDLGYYNHVECVEFLFFNN